MPRWEEWWIYWETAPLVHVVCVTPGIIIIFLASHFNGKCHLESSVKSQRVLYLDLEFLEKFLFILILDPKFELYVIIFSLLWLWTSGSIFSFPFQVIFQRSSPGESCRTSELRPTATLDTFLSDIKVHLGGICCIIHTLYFNPDVLLCTQECLCREYWPENCPLLPGAGATQCL